MSIFPGISPALKHNQGVIRSVLKQSLASLPEVMQSQYKESLASFKTDPRSPDGLIKYICYNYFFYTGMIQFRLFFNDELQFELGVPILTGKPPTPKYDSNFLLERSLECICNDYTLSKHPSPLFLSDSKNKIFYQIVCSKNTIKLTSKILKHEILPITKNYFLYSEESTKDKTGATIFDVSKIFSDSFISIINEQLKKSKQVVVTHFQFQNMETYFKKFGIKYSESFIEAMVRSIRTHLKADDYLIRLNPVSFVVFSPGASKELIENRFKDVFVQVNGLVLNYKLYVVTIDKTNFALNEIIENLKIWL